MVWTDKSTLTVCFQPSFAVASRDQSSHFQHRNHEWETALTDCHAVSPIALAWTQVYTVSYESFHTDNTSLALWDHTSLPEMTPPSLSEKINVNISTPLYLKWQINWNDKQASFSFPHGTRRSCTKEASSSNSWTIMLTPAHHQFGECVSVMCTLRVWSVCDVLRVEQTMLFHACFSC